MGQLFIKILFGACGRVVKVCSSCRARRHCICAVKVGKARSNCSGGYFYVTWSRAKTLVFALRPLDCAMI